MLKMREWDCGCWDDFAAHNRITVRERQDGLYDIVHVRFMHTRDGLSKSESPCGIAHTLKEAREIGWAIWRELSGVE